MWSIMRSVKGSVMGSVMGLVMGSVLGHEVSHGLNDEVGLWVGHGFMNYLELLSREQHDKTFPSKYCCIFG